MVRRPQYLTVQARGPRGPDEGRLEPPSRLVGAWSGDWPWLSAPGASASRRGSGRLPAELPDSLSGLLLARTRLRTPTILTEARFWEASGSAGGPAHPQPDPGGALARSAYGLADGTSCSWAGSSCRVPARRHRAPCLVHGRTGVGLPALITPFRPATDSSAVPTSSWIRSGRRAGIRPFLMAAGALTAATSCPVGGALQPAQYPDRPGSSADAGLPGDGPAAPNRLQQLAPEQKPLGQNGQQAGGQAALRWSRIRTGRRSSARNLLNPRTRGKRVAQARGPGPSTTTSRPPTVYYFRQKTIYVQRSPPGSRHDGSLTGTPSRFRRQAPRPSSAEGHVPSSPTPA